VLQIGSTLVRGPSRHGIVLPVPILRTTWTITHERPLESDEDPIAAAQRVDPDVLLWAIEEGVVTTTVKILEHS
jgi:hypothetical protein